MQVEINGQAFEVTHVASSPEHKEMEDNFAHTIVVYGELLSALPAVGDQLRLDVTDDEVIPGVVMPSELLGQGNVFLEIISRKIAESDGVVHVQYDTQLNGLESESEED